MMKAFVWCESAGSVDSFVVSLRFGGAGLGLAGEPSAAVPRALAVLVGVAWGVGTAAAFGLCPAGVAGARVVVRPAVLSVTEDASSLGSATTVVLALVGGVGRSGDVGTSADCCVSAFWCGPSVSSLPERDCCWDNSRVVCVVMGRAGTRLPLRRIVDELPAWSSTTPAD